MVVHIRAIGEIGVWECVISVKDDVGDRRFAERKELPTAKWSADVMKMVDAEARRRLEGVGVEPLTETKLTGTEYVMRRPFNENDRAELPRYRGGF